VKQNNSWAPTVGRVSTIPIGDFTQPNPFGYRNNLANGIASFPGLAIPASVCSTFAP